MLVDRQRVEERLESRSRLARRADGVEVRRIREIAGAADIRPHFAGGILDHDHGAIIDASIANVDDLPMQRVDDEALQFAIERASRGATFAVQQTLCEVRRERDSRIVAPRLENALSSDEAIAPRDGTEDPNARPRAFARIATDSRRAFGARIKSGQHDGLGRVDSVRSLAEHHARRCADSLQLAAVGHEVQVGLQYFLL